MTQESELLEVDFHTGEVTSGRSLSPAPPLTPSEEESFRNLARGIGGNRVDIPRAIELFANLLILCQRNGTFYPRLLESRVGDVVGKLHDGAHIIRREHRLFCSGVSERKNIDVDIRRLEQRFKIGFNNFPHPPLGLYSVVIDKQPGRMSLSVFQDGIQDGGSLLLDFDFYERWVGLTLIYKTKYNRVIMPLGLTEKEASYYNHPNNDTSSPFVENFLRSILSFLMRSRSFVKLLEGLSWWTIPHAPNGLVGEDGGFLETSLEATNPVFK